jgi:hypothetical protein
VEDKQIENQNYVFLLHSYENLCSCLHKYLLTYLFLCIIIMTTIPPTMDSTHSQTMPKLKINISIPFTNLFYKTFNFSQQVVLLKWKCFQRSRTPIYIFLKKLNKKIPKVLHITCSPCDSTCTLIPVKIFLMTHRLWIIHINLCKKKFNKTSCLSHSH